MTQRWMSKLRAMSPSLGGVLHNTAQDWAVATQSSVISVNGEPQLQRCVTVASQLTTCSVVD